MQSWKKITIIIVIILIAIQFFRPAKNISTVVSANDITLHYPVSQQVQSIIKKGCADCHSNNTVYPWYANFQPVYWWLNSHIEDGKRGLNFNEFASYTIARQYKRLADITDEIKQGDMPLPTYTFEHKDARLTDAEKQTIYEWCTALRDSIKLKYPADSLVIKKR